MIILEVNPWAYWVLTGLNTLGSHSWEILLGFGNLIDEMLGKRCEIWSRSGSLNGTYATLLHIFCWTIIATIGKRQCQNYFQIYWQIVGSIRRFKSQKRDLDYERRGWDALTFARGPCFYIFAKSSTRFDRMATVFAKFVLPFQSSIALSTWRLSWVANGSTML